MTIINDIRHRASVMFAELKGLTLYQGDIDQLEQKDMQDDMELKVRRVRTQAGVRRFNQPIGSIITNKGRALTNISIMDPVFDGWELVKDKKGKRYDIGKDDDGKWRAYGHNDWDDMVVEADNEESLYEALDDRLAPPVDVSSTKPRKVQKPRSIDLTGGKRNERSRRPLNVRTADDEEQEAQRQMQEPKDPSYRRGAARLRSAGINNFSNNDARHVDEMKRDQWEEVQQEIEDGSSLEEALAKRRVVNTAGPSIYERRERRRQEEAERRRQAGQRPSDAKGEDGKKPSDYWDQVNKGPHRAILNSTRYSNASDNRESMEATLSDLKNAQEKILAAERAVEAMPDSDTRESTLKSFKRDLNDAKNAINRIEKLLAKPRSANTKSEAGQAADRAQESIEAYEKMMRTARRTGMHSQDKRLRDVKSELRKRRSELIKFEKQGGSGASAMRVRLALMQIRNILK